MQVISLFPTGLFSATPRYRSNAGHSLPAVNTWAEIWDFGITGGSATTNFALIQDSPGPLQKRVAFAPNNGELDIDPPDYIQADGTTSYTVVTYNNTTVTGKLYTNGVLDGSYHLPGTNYCPGFYGSANGVGTTANYLGNDRFNDPQFGGTIYEFRIWNGAVPQRYISASLVLGYTALVDITSLTPISISVTAPAALVVTGTQQAAVTVSLAQTAAANLPATDDATNWISSNPAVLTVSSSGWITGVGVGSATVSATVAGQTATSSSITVTSQTLMHRYSFVSDASDSVETPLGMGRWWFPAPEPPPPSPAVLSCRGRPAAHSRVMCPCPAALFKATPP